MGALERTRQYTEGLGHKDKRTKTVTVDIISPYPACYGRGWGAGGGGRAEEQGGRIFSRLHA